MTTFEGDMTLRWSCREGDLIVWFRWEHLFSDHPQVSVLDTWSMKKGDFIVITNRWDDIPKSFELHPTEVCDSFVYRLMEQIKAGEAIPDEITDGSNIWRVQSGDAIVWTGVERPGQPGVNEVLSITSFRACALVLGEGNWSSIDDALMFGVSQQESPTHEEMNRARRALKLVQELGMPRSVSTQWLLG